VCSVTSDDILAKYRKPVGHKSADGATVGPPAAVDGVAKTNKDKGDDEVPLYDSSNLEVCQAFLDAKKKLRLILSSVDLQVSLSNATYNSSAPVAFWLVAWHSGRTSVSGLRTFPVLRLTCS